MDVDGIIKQLSSYKHNIQTLIFTECAMYKYDDHYRVDRDKLNTYCEENNITLKINNMA
jgi:hypothetical protein